MEQRGVDAAKRGLNDGASEQESVDNCTRRMSHMRRVDVVI